MDGSVVIQAVLDTANIPKKIKELKGSLEGVTWDGIKEGDAASKRLASSLKSAGTACTIGLTTPIVAAGAAAFNAASSYEQATARIQTALGLTSEEAERLGDVGEAIYEDGFGPSLDAVTDALVIARQNLGDLGDEDLTYVTTAALTLSDALGMDVGESIRGVNALVDGFGMSATDAMDLFVAGAQDGLNYTDELGDNLAEYGPRFAQMGFSAEQYFSILKAGTENGAYNLDKVNDFLNEFQTSLSDGRMDEQIGRFSESTQQLFQSWKDGGATGQQVFEAVMGELAQMPDGYEKANIASELWSSLGEDNAMGMITSLAGVDDKYGDVAGAAGEAGDAMSESFAAKAQATLRELQGAIEPLGQPLLDIATKVAEVVKSFGEWFAGIGEGGQTAVLVVAGVLASIGPLLTMAGNLALVIPTVASALSGAGGAAGLLKGALAALTGSVGVVVAVVAGLVAAILYLWNTNEDFRNAVTEAWNAICTTVQSLIDQLRPYVEQAWTAISAAVQTAMDLIMPIVSAAFQFILAVIVPALQSILATVGSVFGTILSTVAGVMNGITQIIQGAWALITGVFQTVLGVISGIVTGDFTMMSDGISAILSGLTGIFSGTWNAVTSVVEGAVNTVKSVIEGGLNAALSIVGGVFDGIKGAIDDAMGGAANVVSDAIDAIKGFFNFRFEWPHLSLPHITYELIEVPVLGQIPNPATLGVEWYAKGGVFNGPSVIGVGEDGPETVVPYGKRGVMPLAEGIADELGGKASDDEIVRELREIRRRLPEYIRDNSARSIEVNKREVARLVREVS